MLWFKITQARRYSASTSPECRELLRSKIWKKIFYHSVIIHNFSFQVSGAISRTTISDTFFQISERLGNKNRGAYWDILSSIGSIQCSRKSTWVFGGRSDLVVQRNRIKTWSWKRESEREKDWLRGRRRERLRKRWLWLQRTKSLCFIGRFNRPSSWKRRKCTNEES